MIPITRKELYLNKIVGNDDYSVPEKPISKEEFFFAEILGEAVQAPEPLPRYQMYLAKIAGREIEIPYPKVRLEYFLAKAAGMEIETPAPITKEEIYWSNYTAVMEFEVESVPPLVYKAIEGTLKNYRIYGNTVNGESVGDRTANLFDGFSVHGKVPSVSNGELTNSLSGGATTDFIAIDNGDITLSKSYAAKSNMYIFLYAQDKSYIGYSRTATADTLILHGNSINGYQNAKYARIRVDVESSYMQTNIMLNTGSTAKPYEPYGYRVPVSVTNGTDTVTTNLYLPEQIKMVGDGAEYVDYKEQKQHFADGTSTDVLLPALPTISGTNTLSVGTEVQPSKVYIKGEKEREYS